MGSEPIVIERYEEVEKSWENVLKEMSDEHKKRLEKLLEEGACTQSMRRR